MSATLEDLLKIKNKISEAITEAQKELALIKDGKLSITCLDVDFIVHKNSYGVDSSILIDVSLTVEGGSFKFKI